MTRTAQRVTLCLLLLLLYITSPCVAADEWPGYRRGILTLGAPKRHADALFDKSAALPDKPSADVMARVADWWKP